MIIKRIGRAISHAFKNPRILGAYYRRYLPPVKLMVCGIVFLPLKMLLYKKDIWLICEKITEARDNGYHFFKYVKENHPEVNAYYVIAKGSPDSEKVNHYGNIVAANSFRHYLYCLAAKVSICSQPYGALPDPKRELYGLSKCFGRKDQLVVFLQHGITKDEMPHSLDYINTHFDLLCCVSAKEQQFMSMVHGYPNNVAEVLGFCRYDALLSSHEVKKQILIMPTHRMWLHAANSQKAATDRECKEFEKTDFYRAYAQLLTDEKFLCGARLRGYSIVFYLHYATQSFLKCFMKFANDAVSDVQLEHYDVQRLLMESAVLITDFSSVFFDFAYMGKPEVFYQFDEERYRACHFKKGYFDYESDAFGKVCRSEEDTVKETICILEAGCSLSQVYRERADEFFTLRDTNNSKRVFEEVYRKANHNGSRKKSGV